MFVLLTSTTKQLHWPEINSNTFMALFNHAYFRVVLAPIQTKISQIRRGVKSDAGSTAQTKTGANQIMYARFRVARGVVCDNLIL